MPRLEGIRRGPLSDAEKARIESLAESMQKPTPGKIALRLNRHPATIAWHMIRQGLIERQVQYRVTGTNKRGQHYWTREQDDRLLALRRESLSYRRCGEIITAEFGVPRDTHNCQVRAVMLAAYQGGEDGGV